MVKKRRIFSYFCFFFPLFFLFSLSSLLTVLFIIKNSYQVKKGLLQWYQMLKSDFLQVLILVYFFLRLPSQLFPAYAHFQMLSSTSFHWFSFLRFLIIFKFFLKGDYKTKPIFSPLFFFFAFFLFVLCCFFIFATCYSIMKLNKKNWN